MQKRTSMKLLLAGILAFVLCTAWSPQVARAEGNAPDGIWTDSAATAFAGGSGTKADPYQIETPEQLAKLAADVNSGVWGQTHSGEYFALKADLDLSAHRWIPIGNGTNHSSFHSFYGYFDGENHTISGLYVDESAEYYSAGLFGHVTLSNAVEEVKLQNLNLTNAYVKTEASDPDGAGILVGHISNVKVRNCHVSGTVTGSEQIGGMFGTASYVDVEDCTADVQVIGCGNSGGGRAGGMIGNDFNGKYVNCSAKGKVAGSYSVGGFAGTLYWDSVTEFCKAETEVTASDWCAGGFVGYSEEGVEIKNCVSYGTVTSTVDGLNPRIGGFVGHNGASSAITDSHAAGKVTGGTEEFPAGGFLGHDTNGIVKDCSFDAEINPGLAGSAGEAEHPENIVIQAGTTKEVQANICEDYDGGHEAGETTVVDPTCTEDGKKFQTCTKCGAEMNVELIPAVGHQWNTDYTVDKEATCTEEGSESIHCSKCDETKDSRVLPAKGHSYGEWVVTKEPTTTAKGLKEKVCAVCQDRITEDIPMLESGKKTEDPKKTDTSAKDQGKQTAKKTVKKTVKTGDAGSMAGLGLIVLVSGGIVLGYGVRRKQG